MLGGTLIGSTRRKHDLFVPAEQLANRAQRVGALYERCKFGEGGGGRRHALKFSRRAGSEGERVVRDTRSDRAAAGPAAMD
jgi:hypothetical protein